MAFWKRKFACDNLIYTTNKRANKNYSKATPTLVHRTITTIGLGPPNSI
jgi:hypothetical protein